MTDNADGLIEAAAMEAVAGMTAPTPLTADDWRPGDWLVLESPAGPSNSKGDLFRFVDRNDPNPERIRVLDKGDVPVAWHASRLRFLGRPDQSGWIPHDGGPNPAPGLRVECRHRDGLINRDLSAVFWWSHSTHPDDQPADITHWRPHVPAPAGEDHGIKGILGLPVRESDDTPIDWDAPPQPMTARDNLLERLVDIFGVDFETRKVEYINPDGPEAKARIEALEGEIATLRAAKWDVKHVDTMNDFVAMGMSRDDAIAQRDEAVKALERLASMEALDTARSVHPVRDAELTARIMFADAARASIKGKTNEQG